MQAIPSLRAAHLIPYLNFLREIGVPVERQLRQAKLSTWFAKRPDVYIPLHPSLKYLKEAAASEGIDDLGFLAAKRLEMKDLSGPFIEAARTAPTLLVALRRFCNLSSQEATYVRFWMVAGSTGVKVYSNFCVATDMESLRYSEWSQNLALVAIARAFADRDWYPTEIGFRSTVPICPATAAEFPNTRFLVGQCAAWIEIPRPVLSLPPPQVHPERSLSAALTDTEPAGDFVASLKLLLGGYLPEGYPPIKLAAEIADTSVRTLQRRLTQAGLSYSELVQQLRFEAAARRLQDPDIKVIDVAYELGWQDSANFARAFRSRAGLSPRQYREYLSSH